MYKEIITPEILPNNIRAIMTMKDVSIKELAPSLDLNLSYISSLQNHKVNMSGITALKIIDYLDTTFTLMFDKNTKDMVLPVKVETKKQIEVNLPIRQKNLDITIGQNLYDVELLLTDYLKKNKIEGNIENFDIVKTGESFGEDEVMATIEITLIVEVLEDKKFDINFFEELDYDLFEKLYNKSFTEIKEIKLNSNEFKINDGEFEITDYTKIDKIQKHYKESKINIRSDMVKLSMDNQKITKADVTIEFEKLFNIDFIKEYLGISDDDITKALGINLKFYQKLLVGKQRIPTKLMWKMCKLFKVPLEVFLNVPLYLKIFG